jgi:hypothetical protein
VYCLITIVHPLQYESFTKYTNKIRGLTRSDKFFYVRRTGKIEKDDREGYKRVG